MTNNEMALITGIAVDKVNEVLGKIRAEIESKEMIETTSEREFYNMALNDVLQIIDKYKAEDKE